MALIPPDILQLVSHCLTDSTPGIDPAPFARPINTSSIGMIERITCIYEVVFSPGEFDHYAKII